MIASVWAFVKTWFWWHGSALFIESDQKLYSDGFNVSWYNPFCGGLGVNHSSVLVAFALIPIKALSFGEIDIESNQWPIQERLFIEAIDGLILVMWMCIESNHSFILLHWNCSLFMWLLLSFIGLLWRKMALNPRRVPFALVAFPIKAGFLWAWCKQYLIGFRVSNIESDERTILIADKESYQTWWLWYEHSLNLIYSEGFYLA